MLTTQHFMIDAVLGDGDMVWAELEKLKEFHKNAYENVNKARKALKERMWAYKEELPFFKRLWSDLTAGSMITEPYVEMMTVRLVGDLLRSGELRRKGILVEINKTTYERIVRLAEIKEIEIEIYCDHFCWMSG